MAVGSDRNRCRIGSWALAVLAGIIVSVLLIVLGNWAPLQAIFLGLVALAAVGALVSWTLCAGRPVAGAQVSAAPSRPSAPLSPSAGSSAAGASVAPAAAAPVRAGTEDLPRPQEDASEAVGKDTPHREGGVVPAPQPVTTKVAPDVGAAPRPEPTTEAAEPRAPATSEPSGTPAAPDPAPAAPPQDRPAGLPEARDGGPDDLQRIRGIGPKIESMLHRLGYFHYDQIAAWTAAEVAWVDVNLEGFRGRVSRDNWVEQARLLAARREAEVAGPADGDLT